jgi:hypothetical protein
MYYRSLAALIWRNLTGRAAVGRNIETYPDDTFLVSFPKSGSTWARFLVANLVGQNEPVTFANIDRIVPTIYIASKRLVYTLPRPRIIKSHENFDPRYKRVIYIVRDPRDVVVSKYHHEAKFRRLEDGYPMERMVKRWIAGEFDLCGSWGQNVGTWLVARQHSPNFLLLRYEDMIQQSVEQLKKIASFLGIEASDDTLAQVAELSSADRMRAMEKVQSDVWKLTRNTRKDMAFVRKAKAGNYQSELPQESIAEIEAAWGPLMQRLGYDLAMDAAKIPSATWASFHWLSWRQQTNE